ncbi:putative L-iditol 2-dehydrogenase [Lacticaseibacillus rhamnosus MTCC 5462]|nr:putative L-iditol 2-dehydrogenase [Lacticaseibacillus rhamnosus MTCC 5462]
MAVVQLANLRFKMPDFMEQVMLSLSISLMTNSSLQKLGADYTINGKTQDVVKEIQKITAHGVDVAVDCAGSRFTEIEALEITRRDGNVVFVGISGDDLPIKKMSLNSTF